MTVMKATGTARSVFVCVTGERARQRVCRAIDLVGAEPVPISFAQLQSGRYEGLHGLVYDLSPWTAASAATLMGILDSHPEARIFLYVPVRAEALEMVSGFAGMGHVCTKVENSSVATFGLLCGLVGYVASGGADALCERAVSQAVPGLTPAMRNLVRVAAANVARPTSLGAPNVEMLARELGVSPRTLVRRFTGVGLPPPKEFLDWMLLLQVADKTVREGGPALHAARTLGCNANAFYRIKKRRLGSGATGAMHSTDFLVELFVDRCRALSKKRPAAKRKPVVVQSVDAAASTTGSRTLVGSPSARE